MKFSIIYIAIGLLLFSCETPKSESKEPINDSFKFEVKYFGALKNMMHKGDVSAKANLSDFEKSEHLYAIGALENLKGEIQIIDGESFNTFVLDSAIRFDKSFDRKAALLVYAIVEAWNTYEIPADIKTYEQLEGHIASVAKQNGINVNEPFPFLIDGTAKSFDWHVINWKDGDTEHSHEKHVNSGLNGTIENKEVKLLGFYSDSHHAIFTHHTTNMHIHVKTIDNEIAGHVDGLTLGKGMLLKLPAVN
ncbi:MAG: alpha-acetolactate decarboxylase [Crocinitomicaceae bacterium]|jgi:alpha-acetolactate decarboxylase